MNMLNILLGEEEPPCLSPEAKSHTTRFASGEVDHDPEPPREIAITFMVPGMPMGKERPVFSRNNGQVGVRTAPKTSAHEKLVGWHAKGAMKAEAPIAGPVHLDLEFRFPIPTSWTLKRKGEANAGLIVPTTTPDIDNVAKLVCDALNGICYFDDRQVVSMSLTKRYDADPCTVVTVKARSDLKGTK